MERLQQIRAATGLQSFQKVAVFQNHQRFAILIRCLPGFALVHLSATIFGVRSWIAFCTAYPPLKPCFLGPPDLEIAPHTFHLDLVQKYSKQYKTIIFEVPQPHLQKFVHSLASSSHADDGGLLWFFQWCRQPGARCPRLSRSPQHTGCSF